MLHQIVLLYSSNGWGKVSPYVLFHRVAYPTPVTIGAQFQRPRCQRANVGMVRPLLDMILFY